MIKRTNAFAGALLAGLLGLGLYTQFAGQPAKPGEPLITLSLPDIDADKKADFLYITAPTNGESAVMMTHTVNNRSGQVISLPVDGPLTLSGSNPRWQVKDAAGRTRVTISLVKSAPEATPDLVVASDAQAKRWVWMERGYLKLDAFTVTPGFAVGLLMVGDPQSSLEAISVAADAEGMWKQPVNAGPAVHVKFNDKHEVADLTYDSPLYTCDFNLKPGQPLDETAKQLPARYEQDRWIAPTYGLIGEMDSHKKITRLTVTRPWNEPRSGQKGK